MVAVRLAMKKQPEKILYKRRAIELFKTDSPFKPRIVKMKTRYSRKNKHKSKESDGFKDNGMQ
jgi:hypothetical protein